MTKPAERAMIVIAVLLATMSMHLAREVLIPVALALVLVSLLWPVVQGLARRRVPASVGAAICILGTVAIFAAAVAALGTPARAFADKIPSSIEAARPKLAAISATIGRLTGTQSAAPSKPGAVKNDSTLTDSGQSRAATAATRADSSNTRSDSVPSTQTAPASSGQPGGLPSSAPATVTHVIGITGSLLGEFIEVMLLALFLLAAGTAWKDKLVQSVNTVTKVNSVTEAVSEMRKVVSRYVFVTVLINVAQGVVVGIALKLLDYPSPLLWGVLTFALEFVPYLGGMVVVALITIAGLAAGRGFPSVFFGPAAYLTVTTLQNNVLSPIVYGSRMKLNPTAILLSLMLMYMLWGVAGAFLAVPILAAFNVLASRVQSLKPVNTFLSD